MFYERTKYRDGNFHFIQDMISEGIVKVPTKENPFDTMTKVLMFSKFRHCLKLLEIKVN